MEENNNQKEFVYLTLESRYPELLDADITFSLINCNTEYFKKVEKESKFE